MDEESYEFDFNGKSNEEVLSAFFHEIRGSVSSVVGYLTMLNLMKLPDGNNEHYVEPALKRALFIQDRVNEVFEYLDEQRKGQ